MHARQAEQFSQLAQVSPAETVAPEAATPAATTPVAPATVEAPEAKSDCSKSILATFFPDDTAPASPISQFQKFVQETCPSLKLQVPSKYRKFWWKTFNFVSYRILTQVFSLFRWRCRDILLPHWLLLTENFAPIGWRHSSSQINWRSWRNCWLIPSLCWWLLRKVARCSSLENWFRQGN